LSNVDGGLVSVKVVFTFLQDSSAHAVFTGNTNKHSQISRQDKQSKSTLWNTLSFTALLIHVFAGTP